MSNQDIDIDFNCISIIIPAKNEEAGLKKILPELKAISNEWQVLIVNDGSDDGTVDVCKQYNVEVESHQYSKGNGAAIKTGARLARGKILIFMDADGQHSPQDIVSLLDYYNEGYDLVVGARGRRGQASFLRWVGNTIYRAFASWMTGRDVVDLTSGFRVVNAEKFRSFLDLLPNGFSYPTTSTMAFFRAGYSVGYFPIEVSRRIGDSHINIMRDGVRFLLIIFRVGTLYSPLKIFFPVSLMLLVAGLGYYGFTYLVDGRFTNMSALLLQTSILVFLMGLISEQVTTLIFLQKKTNNYSDD